MSCCLRRKTCCSGSEGGKEGGRDGGVKSDEWLGHQ